MVPWWWCVVAFVVGQLAVLLAFYVGYLLSKRNLGTYELVRVEAEGLPKLELVEKDRGN